MFNFSHPKLYKNKLINYLLTNNSGEQITIPYWNQGFSTEKMSLANIDNGITWLRSSDGTCSASGTLTEGASSSKWFVQAPSENFSFLVPGHSYYITYQNGSIPGVNIGYYPGTYTTTSGENGTILKITGYTFIEGHSSRLDYMGLKYEFAPTGEQSRTISATIPAPYYVDLTDLYGYGNEPTSLSDERITEIINALDISKSFKDTKWNYSGDRCTYGRLDDASGAAQSISSGLMCDELVNCNGYEYTTVRCYEMSTYDCYIYFYNSSLQLIQRIKVTSYYQDIDFPQGTAWLTYGLQLKDTTETITADAISDCAVYTRMRSYLSLRPPYQAPFNVPVGTHVTWEDFDVVFDDKGNFTLTLAQPKTTYGTIYFPVKPAYSMNLSDEYGYKLCYTGNFNINQTSQEKKNVNCKVCPDYSNSEYDHDQRFDYENIIMFNNVKTNTIIYPNHQYAVMLADIYPAGTYTIRFDLRKYRISNNPYTPATELPDGTYELKTYYDDTVEFNVNNSTENFSLTFENDVTEDQYYHCTINSGITAGYLSGIKYQPVATEDILPGSWLSLNVYSHPTTYYGYKLYLDCFDGTNAPFAAFSLEDSHGSYATETQIQLEGDIKKQTSKSYPVTIHLNNTKIKRFTENEII